jgi:hypothetical protein
MWQLFSENHQIRSSQSKLAVRTIEKSIKGRKSKDLANIATRP